MGNLAGTDAALRKAGSSLRKMPEVQVILAHPNNPDMIFVGTQDGPYRSTDGGDSNPIDARAEEGGAAAASVWPSKMGHDGMTKAL